MMIRYEFIVNRLTELEFENLPWFWVFFICFTMEGEEEGEEGFNLNKSLCYWKLFKRVSYSTYLIIVVIN